MEALHAIVVSSLSNCPAATHAAVLLKIFLLQRSSLSPPYSFHPLAPPLLVADALASGSASRALSSYQVTCGHLRTHPPPHNPNTKRQSVPFCRFSGWSLNASLLQQEPCRGGSSHRSPRPLHSTHPQGMYLQTTSA